jgi:hypothetical protein
MTGEIIVGNAEEGIFVCEITNENRRNLAHIALMMYADEPCRICGEAITKTDVYDAVFVGCSRDGKSRAAHKLCWQEKTDHKPDADWVHQ